MSFRPSDIEPVPTTEMPSPSDAARNIDVLKSGPFQRIKETLRNLYINDERPWLLEIYGGRESISEEALIRVKALFDEVVAYLVARQSANPHR